MKTITPNETALVGSWVADPSGTVEADEVCQRINWLTKNALEHVAFSSDCGMWETLFRDPVDGRFWERTYPQGHLHGGGPPTLKVISAEDARRKYDLK